MNIQGKILDDPQLFSGALLAITDSLQSDSLYFGLGILEQIDIQNLNWQAPFLRII